MEGLSRRQFVLGAGALALGAGCGRLPFLSRSESQQSTTVARIGILTGTRREGSGTVDVFLERLTELGWVDGRNASIEYRGSDGQSARLPELASELVQVPVDVIFAAGPTPVRAARDATSTIPIVMIFSADPVADGLVSSLARPGGNVTGFTNYAAQLGAKRLDLLTEALPGISRVAALWDPAGADPGGELRELEAAALQRGARLVPIEVRTPDDLEAAFDTAVGEQAAGVLPLSGGVFFENHLRVVDLAAQKRLPAIYWVRRFVDAGGLMSYSSTLMAQYRRAADYVDRILRGMKPADLPVEQPMTFEFVVNLKTARALGITFPPQILLQVTEVVE